MRSTYLADTLKARAAAFFKGANIRPSYVVGPPGIGKTELTKSVAAELGCGLMTLHAPIMLTEDFGMPRLDTGGEIEFATPGRKFPFEGTDCPEFGILDVEEVAQASPDQQKIWANLFLERDVHGRKLKPGWYIIATGNRMQDRAGATRILSHFNDRFTTYEMDVNVDDWCNWALTHAVRPEVVAFMRWRPDLLHKFDPNMDKNPTPRSWTQGVSPALDTVPEHALYDTIRGDVGEGPAAEFAGFLATFRSLPNPDLVLANPTTAEVPTEASVRYALCGALSHRADEKNFGNLLVYAKRLPPEFQVLIVRDTVKAKPQLLETRAFIDWSVKEGFDILG